NHETCFLVKARKRAMEADIVVINHHLFFADSQLKKEGFSELLPGVDVVVFDEAHQLADIASNFNGERLGTRQFKDLVDDMLNEWPILDLANQPLKSISHKADKLVDQLLNALPTREERISWELVKRNKEFMEAWNTWLSLKDELIQCLESKDTVDIPGLKRCQERLLDLETVLLSFTEENNHKIRWLERFKHTLVFHATPYDVAESFSQLLKDQSCAYIFTSATLTMASAFDSFCKPLG
ncbi:TPA: ATP-dependent DNA helicase, partial [Legionella pneumophila]|nr:ATP-dependent DNA helicase [Legionella pneumophila]